MLCKFKKKNSDNYCFLLKNIFLMFFYCLFDNGIKNNNLQFELVILLLVWIKTHVAVQNQHVVDVDFLLCPVGGATRRSEGGDRNNTWVTFPQERHPGWCSNYKKNLRHFSRLSGASFFNCMISLPGPYFENFTVQLLWQRCHPLRLRNTVDPLAGTLIV